MELTEISDRIDTELNSFDGGISVDEYEKSLYLTKVQKKMYYDLLKAFEMNGIITHLLKPFLKDAVITTLAVPTPIAIPGAQYFELPVDIEKIVYETATLNIPADESLHGKVTDVRATKIAEMSYKMDNPFSEPDATETIRVISEKSTSDLAELHAAAPISAYNIKYLKKILPIVLEALPDGLTIDGVGIATNTVFNDEMLDTIIDGVVKSILKDKLLQKQNV